MTQVPNQFSTYWLRHASPFINQHRDRTFVVLLKGEVLQHSNLPTIISDLVLLHSLGVRLIIVHGSRPQIDHRLGEAGIKSSFKHGYRVTTDKMMRFVAEAVGETRLALEAKLTTDIEASPMHGAKVRVLSGNFIIAKPRGVIEGMDFFHSGDVRKVDTEGIARALDSRCVVLLSHIGYSRTGELFNLNSEAVAQEIAIELEADKLIIFTEAQGLKKGQNLIRHTTPQACMEYADLPENLSEASLFQSAAKATLNGVSRAHTVSFTEDGALLKELFTRDGTGTLITNQEVESLRRAESKDIGRLIHLLRPLEQDGTLVERSRQVLEREIHQFFVVEKENLLIGCAALYPFSNSLGGELACFAVRDDYRGQGVGNRLLRRIEREARNSAITELYVLTTKTAHWFLERGFREVNPEALTSARQKPYNLQRNSKVFCKNIEKDDSRA